MKRSVLVLLWVVLLIVTAPLMAPGTASALTAYTWTGAVPQGAGATNWSNATNWGGSAPSGSVGTLTFPALTGNPACTSPPTTAACYGSHNDLSGISATGLVLDNGYGYSLSGNGITVGAGGITATPTSGHSADNILSMPLTLSAPQTWAIDGGMGDDLLIWDNVTGQADALTINLSNFAPLLFSNGGNAEVGPISVSGNGELVLGIGATAASLNGTDANPVSLSGNTFLRTGNQNDSVGPLTVGNGSTVEVGNGSTTDAAGTLAVSGGLTLGAGSKVSMHIIKPGTTAGTSYSQLSATGTVALGSGTADLDLLDSTNETNGDCETLNEGDVLTLITTTGSVTGTFDGVPDGTTVSLFGCSASGPRPAAVIHYTAHSVTATVVSSGPPPCCLLTSTALGVENTTPAIGEAVTYKATVAAESDEPAPDGAVTFLDGETPIPSCEAQSLTRGTFSSLATCTVSYPAAGSHLIEAAYEGTDIYGESRSAGQIVTVHGTSASGGGGSTGGGSTPAPQPTPHPRKPPKCHKGFKKKVVKGKARCVKVRHHKPAHGRR